MWRYIILHLHKCNKNTLKYAIPLCFFPYWRELAIRSFGDNPTDRCFAIEFHVEFRAVHVERVLLVEV